MKTEVEEQEEKSMHQFFIAHLFLLFLALVYILGLLKKLEPQAFVCCFSRWSLENTTKKMSSSMRQ